MKNKYIGKNLQNIQDAYTYLAQSSEGFDCFLSDCSNKSIDSHSISKSRVFKVFTSDKSEKLLMLEDKYSSDFSKGKMSSFQARNRELIPVSQVSASTYRGFCSHCDSELFKDLDDQPYSNTPKINFLHVLRAYSFKLREERKLFQLISDKILQLGETVDDDAANENHPALNLLNLLPKSAMVLWEMASPILDQLSMEIDALSVVVPNLENDHEIIKLRDISVLNKESYPMTLINFKNGLFNLLKLKNERMDELKESKESGNIKDIEEYASEVLKHQYEISEELTKCLRNESYGDFQNVTHSINGIHKIAGNFIYYTSDNEEIVLTFFPESETKKTIFIFSAWNPSHSQEIYLKKINLLEPSAIKQFVSNIILSQGTNIYLSQDFLETLEQKEKELLSQVKTLNSFLSFNLFK